MMTRPEEESCATKSRSRERGKRLLPWLLALMLVTVSFAWGVAYTRHYVFPHSLISSLARWFHGADSQAPIAQSGSGGVSIRRPSSFELLQTLGYVGTSTANAANGQGASVVDAVRMQPGLSLYTTGHADVARLIDEAGALVHQWALPRDQVWWDSPLAQRQQFVGIRSATVLPDLSLLAIYDYLGLMKLDRDSTPIWIVRNGAHHDMWITEDDRIFLLNHHLAKVPEIHPNQQMVIDMVTVLDSQGNTIGEYSLVDLMLRSPFAFLLPSVNDLATDYPIDLLHTNSIQVFDGSLASLEPRLFAKGNVLLSLRNISTLVIADLDAGEVLWAWGPSNITFQHSARLLPGGSILLFDNGLEWSTAVEIDPLTRRRLWSWRGSDNDRLRSRIYGSCQRQPNGNTLIVDSMQARALEVSPEGQIAWTFLTPPLEDGRVPVLYSMTRYDRSYFQANQKSQR